MGIGLGFGGGERGDIAEAKPPTAAWLADRSKAARVAQAIDGCRANMKDLRDFARAKQTEVLRFCWGYRGLGLTGRLPRLKATLRRFPLRIGWRGLRIERGLSGDVERIQVAHEEEEPAARGAFGWQPAGFRP